MPFKREELYFHSPAVAANTEKSADYDGISIYGCEKASNAGKRDKRVAEINI